MSSNRLAQLRTRLAGLRGPSRVEPLLEIAGELGNRHGEIGPGRPEALALLTEAIGASEEAYGHLAAEDTRRAPTAARLGTLIGTRHLAHGGADDDRVRAIALLEDGLGVPQLVPASQTRYRLMLGQLHLVVSARALTGADRAARTAGPALPPTAESDVDRAIRHFRAVLGTPAVPARSWYAAESLLTLADAVRVIVVGVPGQPSPETTDKLTEAVRTVQRFRADQAPRAGRLADADPLDRPVMMDVNPAPPNQPGPKPARSPRPNDRVAAMRNRLRDLFAHDCGLFTAIEGLLAPGARPLPADRVDEIVALATAVVDSGRANRTDHLLYALGLLFRGRAAGSPANRLDVEDAADHLLRAAGSARPAPSEVVRAMRDLAAALDRLQPRAGVSEQLSSILAGV